MKNKPNITITAIAAIILLLDLTSSVFAQNIDSLKLALKTAKHDTTRCNILNEMIEAENDDAVWPKYNDELLQLAESKLKTTKKAIKEYLFYQKHLAGALNNIGYLANSQDDLPKALEYYSKSLQLREEIGDKEGIAGSLNNIGFIYRNQGNISKALEYYSKSLKNREEIGDKSGIANSLNNIGGIYVNQNDIPKALEYFSKSLKIKEEIGDKVGIAISLNNIGAIYNSQGDLSKALEYYSKSLKLREEIGDKRGIAESLNNIGFIYRNQDNIPKSLEYFSKSIQLREEIGDKVGIAISLNNIGGVYLKQKYYNRALEYCSQALKVSNELGYPEFIRNAAKSLSEIYKATGKHQLALENYELFILMRDSINNETTQKASIQTQFQYEYEKKAAADSVVNAKANEIRDAQIAQQKAEIKAKRNQQYALYGGLALVLVFAGFMYNRFKVTQKQKGIIEEKERETYAQKEVIEEKHKAITDSIQYAKRIQNAILPPQKLVKEYLPENFILYQPKDVVAGDFYWLEVAPLNPPEGGNTHAQAGGNVQRKLPPSGGGGAILFAAADCTGHGVPGAMVSVVCNNGLNRSVREYGITDPGKLLDKTREIVIAEFEKSEEDVKDGMDIALCSLKLFESYATLQYAGANNPLYLIKADNKNELIEIKPNKQPIGKIDNPQPFTTHTINLQQGDTIYIFTDGYADQFGGEKGKKLMYKPFKELLLSIQDKTMDEQKEILDHYFNDWKGSLEQVDDVCIIGVRI